MSDRTMKAKTHYIITPQAPLSIPFTFPYQSYCDSTLLQSAILQMNNGEAIIGSTKQTVQEGGVAIALEPWSEAPIAVQLSPSQGSKSAGSFILKPGQMVIPVGTKLENDENAHFPNFFYGLPYGWLGGGVVGLKVFRSFGSIESWHGGVGTEVLFHQFRYQIKAANAIPANPTQDWPTRFPWPSAKFAGQNVGNSPILRIAKVSKVRFRLRLNSPAVLSAMLVYRGINDLDVGNDGLTAGVVDETFIPISWNGDVNGLGVAGNGYPVTFLEDHFADFGSDKGGVDILDNTGAGTIAGVYVDVQRYGYLG